jgi:hypothetical protein
MEINMAVSRLHRELYLAGMKEGTRDWAHWKDGGQYVGTCGVRLDSAIAEAEDDTGKGRYDLVIARIEQQYSGNGK